MVALTPAKDKFKSICIIAIVAARPIAGVEDTPPQIDIYFSRTDEIEIDPQLEWTMVEAKQGYFESARHTLKALQKLSQEGYDSWPASAG
jgi:helicase required for RNAi-mediated heterochromatin assembly 1